MISQKFLWIFLQYLNFAIHVLNPNLEQYAPKKKKVKKSWVTKEIKQNISKRDLSFKNWGNSSNKTYPVSSKGLFCMFRLLCDRESSFQQSNISAESFNK